MLLEQRGMLNIEDTVTDIILQQGVSYLPDTDDYAIPYKGEITIKNLLSHRGGVFDIFNGPSPY